MHQSANLDNVATTIMTSEARTARAKIPLYGFSPSEVISVPRTLGNTVGMKCMIAHSATPLTSHIIIIVLFG